MDNHAIHLTRPHELQEALERGTFSVGARVTFVVEAIFYQSQAFGPSRFHQGAAGLILDLAGRKIVPGISGLPGVDGTSGEPELRHGDCNLQG